MGNWLEAFFISLIAVGFGVGFLGLFIVPMVGAAVGRGDDAVFSKAARSTIKVLIVIAIIGISIDHPNYKQGNTSSNNSGISSHKCCVCGENAYATYGGDYWCAYHYSMCKAIEDYDG